MALNQCRRCQNLQEIFGIFRLPHRKGAHSYFSAKITPTPSHKLAISNVAKFSGHEQEEKCYKYAVIYKVKISELVNILVPSVTVCAMLLPICIIRRFKDPHIQASRLKSWMFCNTGHLDLRLLFNFLPYLHYFMTTYAFGYWRHRLTHSTLTPKLQ